MNKTLIVSCLACVCMCNAYADNIIKLRCGASFREVPKERCFADSRTKTIDEVTYTYRIFKTNNDGSGMFEGSNGEFEVPIGLKIKKADFPSKKENISIPASIDGVPIVEIGFACFEKRSRLKSITLPKTVISISS